MKRRKLCYIVALASLFSITEPIAKEEMLVYDNFDSNICEQKEDRDYAFNPLYWSRLRIIGNLRRNVVS